VRYFVFAISPRPGSHVKPEQSSILSERLRPGTISWLDHPPLLPEPVRQGLRLPLEATDPAWRPILAQLQKQDPPFRYRLLLAGHCACPEGGAGTVSAGPIAPDPRQTTLSVRISVTGAKPSTVLKQSQGKLSMAGPGPGESGSGSWGNRQVDLLLGRTYVEAAVVDRERALLVAFCIAPGDR
jgi:hypothetical protein